MQLNQVLTIAQVAAPKDINGGARNSGPFSMKNVEQLLLLILIGNLAGDVTLTIEECDDTTPSASTAIAFNYVKADAGADLGSHLDGALAAATSAGITIANASDDNKIIGVEINAHELTDGYPYVRACLSDPSAAGLFAVVAVGGFPRFMNKPSSQIDPIV